MHPGSFKDARPNWWENIIHQLVQGSWAEFKVNMNEVRLALQGASMLTHKKSEMEAKFSASGETSKKVLRDEFAKSNAALDNVFDAFKNKLELHLPFVRVNVTRVQKIHHRYRRGPKNGTGAGGVMGGGGGNSPKNGGSSQKAR